MKSKTQKRKEALARREKDLAYWQGGVRKDKIARAEADIAALKAKLGQ